MTAAATISRTAVEDLVRSIYRLGLVQRALAREVSQGLGSQGFSALAFVHTEGPIRIGSVAQHLGVDLSVASRQIAALEAAGYVEREPDPADRRAHRVSVTDAGRRAVRAVHRRIVDHLSDVLAGWTEQEVTDLAAALVRLREDFARTSEPRPETVTR
jgi:DNA-binding MarR family transcriptional regulator